MRSLFALLLCLLIAAPVAGQEQRGSIEGVVRDSSGGVLPGVTVEARSPAMVGVTTVVTDTAGVYRFPSLPPGRYEITGTLQGFSAAKAANVQLELGQVLKVGLTLAIGGVAESVQVKGESPLIDVKQNAAGADIQREVIDRVPKGRDFTAIATSAPGIDNESRNSGIQIDGASGADNRFVIDGVDTTNLARGTSNKILRPDFIQEIQVKASGYNAEYRAAIGGVVSAITKSGSNAWHGGAGAYYNSDGLLGAVRPTLQLNPSNQKEAQYVKAPPDKFKNEEGVFDIGGPIGARSPSAPADRPAPSSRSRSTRRRATTSPASSETTCASSSPRRTSGSKAVSPSRTSRPTAPAPATRRSFRARPATTRSRTRTRASSTGCRARIPTRT
jgi:hypothetical protein